MPAHASSHPTAALRFAAWSSARSIPAVWAAKVRSTWHRRGRRTQASPCSFPRAPGQASFSPSLTARWSNSHDASCISPRGQPHALSRVDKSGAAFEFLGFRTAGAIEITRRFLDECHSIAKEAGKNLGTCQPFTERHRAGFTRTLLRTSIRLTPRTASLDWSSVSSTRCGQSALIELPAKDLVAGVDIHTAPMRRDADRSKKRSRRRRRLKVITGRRQTEWTGATQCPEDGRYL